VRDLSAGRGLDRLDPTSGLLTGEGHIPLACTPRASSAAPIEGEVEKRRGKILLRHMTVDEGARRTHGATTTALTPTEQVGDVAPRSATRSSATSGKGDVRLTMGGEPTFGLDRRHDGDEWNTLGAGGRRMLCCGCRPCPVPAPARPKSFCARAAPLAAFRPRQVVSRNREQLPRSWAAQRRSCH